MAPGKPNSKAPPEDIDNSTGEEECGQSMPGWDEKHGKHRWPEKTHEVSPGDSRAKGNKPFPEIYLAADSKITLQSLGEGNCSGFQDGSEVPTGSNKCSTGGF